MPRKPKAQNRSGKESDGTRSWLDRIAQALAGVPEDRHSLLNLLRAAETRKLLDPETMPMIEGTLKIIDMRVRDIMVPRIRMVMASEQAPQDELLETFVSSGYSRLPIVGENADSILGILIAKDLLGYVLSKPQKLDIRDLVRPAMLVPESKALNVLLREVRSARSHIAIVVDEYGGIAGLVTIEDIIEEIVGNIEDEHDREEEEENIRHLDGDRYAIKAITPLEDFNDYFGTEMDAEECDTVGGLVLKGFGRMPRKNESAVVEGQRFDILQADKRRIHLIGFQGRKKAREDAT